MFIRHICTLVGNVAQKSAQDIPPGMAVLAQLASWQAQYFTQ